VEVLGTTLGADRAGYALADASAGAVILDAQWGSRWNAPPTLHYRDFGLTREALIAGDAVCINDIEAGGEATEGYAQLVGGNTRALLAVPVHERGKPVAFAFVRSARVQTWTTEHIQFARAVAERMRAARAQIRTEHRRRESDQQMMLFADTMPVQVWAADSSGMLYWYNRQVVAYSGFTSAELDGLGYQEIIHPDDMHLALDGWYESIALGTKHETSFRIRRSDGEYRWFVCRSEPIFDEEGNIVRLMGTNTDIHDQRCAQEELARINHDLEAEVADRTQERDLTWKTASDLFSVKSPDTGLFRMNPAWSQMLGWSDAEILTRGDSSLVHHEDVQSTGEALAQLRQDGDRVHFENRLIRKDGKHVWIAWIVTRLGGKHYATGRDVTATRRLLKAQQDLTHASRVATLGELTASIAHEVNQPLAAIIANGKAARRWLTRQTPDLDEAREALARMTGEAIRASDIIGRIRRLAVRGDPDRLQVDLEALLQETMSLVRAQLRAHGTSVELAVPPSLPAVWADRIQLQQVIINLLLNAAQAMAQACCERRLITIDVRSIGNEVDLTVSDTGPGIEEANVAQVFDAFYTTKTDGMGIGLSISKTIMEAHGGTLTLETERGSGTRFTMKLPAMTDM
jgi:PAS domain S-box-containing protein